MGDFTRTSETGDYETPSETIGALIEREWTKANTDSQIPKFLYDQDAAGMINPTEMMEAVVVTDAGTLPIPERTATGHGLVGVGEAIVITVFAASQKHRKLFEFEIHRILRTFRPISTAAFTPIKKSDGTSNSAIHDYDEIIPEFVAFENGDLEEKSSKSSAVLTLLMEWSYA